MARPAPAYAYNFFTGVPAPAGAGVALFPLFLGLEAKALGLGWLLSVAQFPLFCALVLAGTAFLLVSTLPVWSFKNFKVPHEYVLPLLLGAGDLRRRSGRRSLGRAGGRRTDVSRHAAV